MRNMKSLCRGERGSALIEFVLCFGLFWVPLFLGTLQIGFNLIRAVQVTQVCRDAGHMYSRGTDFSQSSYQNLLQSLAPNLNLLTSGNANATVILSTITYIQQTDCVAAGYPTCSNAGQFVVTRRITVGANSGLPASAYGTPAQSTYADSSGNITVAGYMNDTSTQAPAFANVIPALTSGQYAYVAEMYVQSQDYNWWSFLGTTGVSARSVF